MAEISRQRESQKEQLLHYWLLEFACHRAYVELVENKCVQNTDFIQGVLHMSQDQEKAMIKVHLLLLMCKLSNGEDYSTRYVADSDLTVLEEVLTSFDMVIKSFYKDSDIRKNSSKIRLAIMKQAVYVCCRAGDFDTADTVFTRQWTDGDVDKKQRSAVQAIIKSKKASHQGLKHVTYDSFLDQMIEFLKQILDTFPEPFLLKVNKVYAGYFKKPHDEEESGDAHHSPRKKRCLDFRNLPSHELSSPSQAKLQRKVERIRKEKLNDIVTAALGDNNNSNVVNTKSSNMSDTEDEDDVDKTSLSPTSLAESTRRMVNKLQKRTKNLKKTVDAVKGKTQSSSPEKSPVKKTSSKTPQKSTGLADESSKEESPDPRHSHNRRNSSKSPSTSKSDETVPDSSGKGIRRFQYRRNKDRADRYNRAPTDDSSLSISDDESSDYEPLGGLPRLTGRPQVRRSLELVNCSQRRRPITNKRIAWTQKEEEEFYRAVTRIGVGRWAEVKTYLKTFRTSVNLKDKWRQLTNSGKLEYFKKSMEETECEKHT